MIAFEWWRFHLLVPLFDEFLLLALRAIRAATPYMRNISQLKLTLRVNPSLHYLSAGELNHFRDTKVTSLLFIMQYWICTNIDSLEGNCLTIRQIANQRQCALPVVP